MCGIIGFSNFDLAQEKAIKKLKSMSKAISYRGENDEGFYFAGNTYLGHRRLSIIDLENGHQPMSFCFGGNKFTIVYNGEIYNTKFLRKKLTNLNVTLETNCDTELVLKSYAVFKEKCLKFLRGIFAFCIFDQTNGTLFLARDHIGVKPLFYYFKDGKFAFASEIKALFKLGIKPVVSKKGLQNLFGIAPARIPGTTVYDNIFEVKPAQYLVFKSGKIKKKTYFKLKSKPHTFSIKDTAKEIRKRFSSIIKEELASDVNIGMFLSGGIDSSIITSVSAKALKERLKTFSVDYQGSSKNFRSTSFTPTRDNHFINLMVKKHNLKHKYKIITPKALFKSLRQALIARDMPAMADIDGSLLLFCKKIKKDVTVCLSGEFADEIFCGYPWFYKTESKNAKTFPWAIDLALREQTINKNLRKKLDLQNFVQKKFKKALKSVPISPLDTNEDKNMKIFSYLTMNYFGLNLLERTDRMSMQNGLEVRVPFADFKFVQFAYNIPWKMKNLDGYEKGILREAFKGILPDEILFRKKSPYPKSHDPTYACLVEEEIKKLTQKDDKVWQIVDKDFVIKTLKSADNNYPWFGQLMNKTQYLAFVLQISMWLEKYKIILKI